MSFATTSDKVCHRVRHEILVEPQASSRVPLKTHGDFVMTVFRNTLDDAEHFTLIKSTWGTKTPLVRIHSECITGDLFASLKCDCGSQLEQSLALIAKEGGILIYLRQEGRGIGLANKLKAYALQEEGLDTIQANEELGLPVDNRDYVIAVQILKYLNIQKIRLLTNNPQKVAALTDSGIEIEHRVTLKSCVTTENKNYLKVKQEKLGHFLDIQTEGCEHAN